MIKLVEMENKKGTTTIGLVCKNGVVLAADKRGSMGHLAMHKKIEKIWKVTDNIGITMAGMVGDAQKLRDYLKSELKLYSLEREEEPSIEVASKLLSNLLYSGRRSFIPYMSIFLLGGKSEEEKFRVFSLDSGGSTIHDKYACSGSGMELAYGVLESNYEENMSIKDGKELAVKALNSALQRDVFTGDEINIVTVSKKGYNKLGSKKVEKILKKVKK